MFICMECSILLPPPPQSHFVMSLHLNFTFFACWLLSPTSCEGHLQKQNKFLCFGQTNKCTFVRRIGGWTLYNCWCVALVYSCVGPADTNYAGNEILTRVIGKPVNWQKFKQIKPLWFQKGQIFLVKSPCRWMYPVIWSHCAYSSTHTNFRNSSYLPKHSSLPAFWD